MTMKMLLRITKVCVSFMLMFGLLYHTEKSFAVPAYPGVRTLTQPDGITFSARAFGDEQGYTVETTDGYTILQNPQGYWSYAILNTTCRLVPSTMIVGKDDPMILGVPKHIGPTKEIVQRVCGPKQTPEQPRRLMRIPEQPKRTIPQSQIRAVPVLLITFADTTPSVPTDKFIALLTERAPNSLKDYYQEVVEKMFYLPNEPFNVTGWYNAFYHDLYGQDISRPDGQAGDDALAALLVNHAVIAADAVVNFANYDMDGDCYVDMVFVVHQGRGQEESRNPNDIWSHRWTLNDAMRVGDGAGEVTTRDACQAHPDRTEWMKVNAYTIVPEIILENGRNSDENR